MKTIQLTNGMFTLVDDEDYERLVAMGKWYFSTDLYAINGKSYRKENNKSATVFVRMHRIILNAKPGEFVDHVNGDKLDNRKSNLRICTIAENTRNAGARKNNKSGFKGVHFDKSRGKFTAQITFQSKDIHLGRFLCPKEAARVYNDAALKYHGEFAKLNEIPQ